MPHESLETAPREFNRRKWLHIAVLTALFLAVAVFLDPREVVDAITRISPAALVLAIIVLSIDRLVMGLKWQHLVRGAGGDLGLNDAVGIYFQSKFITLAFPASFGGEVLRGILGTRAGVPGYLVVASMLLERVVAAVSSTVLACIGLFYLLTATVDASYPPIFIVAGAAVMAGLIAVAVLNRRFHAAVGRLVRRYLPERLYSFLDRLSAAASSYRTRPGLLGVNLLINICEHMLQIAALFVLARGLGITLEVAPFLAVTAVIMLVRRGAGMLEGWGLAESGLVMLYNLSGVPAAESVALALALWATSLVASLPGAFMLPKTALRHL
ncbi:MAG: lysylphosphatidylglycerol synthase transmembrane domain-containing protein [Gemmatimonadales bacterium]